VSNSSIPGGSRRGRRRTTDERFGGAVTRVVNGARYQFFAGSAFSLDEHRALQARDVPDQMEDLLHPRVLADDVLQAVPTVEFLLEERVLPLQVLDADNSLTRREISSRLQGLTMYSWAPSFIAVIAVSTVA